MKIIRKILFPFVVEKYDLENKWWHRLIKVIFMIIMFFSAIIIFAELNLDSKIQKIFSYATTPTSVGISLVPKVNASDKNIIQSFLDDTKGNVDFEKKRNAVVEMLKNGEDEAFIEDAIVNKMGYKPAQSTQEKPLLGSQLGTVVKDILLFLVILYGINIALQFVYYKMILYIVYGK